MNILNEPIQAGGLTLKNRIVFPPLTTGYEERDGSIGEKSFNFYKRLAQGGTGYIVIGDVAPVNTASPTPKLYRDEQIPGFRKLADACHEYGAKLGLQIFHPEYDVEGVGRLIVQSMMLRKAGKEEECAVVTKQAYAKLHHDMQHFVSEATPEQLGKILQAMADCAVRAREAGADAIQIHGDRLLGSLCSTALNHRTDEYGGSFENRTRFALETVRAIRAAVPDMMIDYKLPVVTPTENGELRGKGGMILEEAVALAALLEKEGVDMFHVAQANHTGNMNDTIPAMGTREYGFAADCAEAVKKAVSVPVCAVGRIVTPEAAAGVISTGRCDLVGLGRPLVCDPDFANEVAENRPVRLCIMCNKGCTDAIINRSICECVLNAENGAEYRRTVPKTAEPKKVAVVGAGIAGLEAARVASLMGHAVTLYDRALVIGGQINIASIPPRKGEMLRSLEYYKEVLPLQGVSFRLGCEPSKEELNGYDHVLIAVGAYNRDLPVEGHDLPHVVSAWDILAGRSIVFGKVSVLGGGLVGVETAEYLAEQGAQVSIIEMMHEIAKGESSTVLPFIRRHFAERGVREYVDCRVKRIDARNVYCDRTDGEGGEVAVPSDFVVMAVGAKPQSFDAEGITAPVTRIGDCVRPSDISHAVRSAYDAVVAIG